jgi:hypothetical protein
MPRIPTAVSLFANVETTRHVAPTRMLRWRIPDARDRRRLRALGGDPARSSHEDFDAVSYATRGTATIASAAR